MPARSAPSCSIASTVFSSTPPSAPFQPACAAPITRAPGSINSTAPQSAALTPIARFSLSVTIASARGLELAPPPPAVFRDVGGSVPRADAGIEALVDAARHATRAAEKRVAQAGD